MTGILPFSAQASDSAQLAERDQALFPNCLGKKTSSKKKTNEQINAKEKLFD